MEMRRVICRPLRGLSRRRPAQPYPESMLIRRRRLCARGRQDEAEHLPAGVGAASVRVGAADTAAGPSVPRAVQDPLLKYLPASGAELERAPDCSF